MRFLITGYPRSRTAWLAAWLSAGNTICLHEPLEHGSPVSDWQRLVDGLPHDTVGLADSSLPLQSQEVMDFWGERVVIVHRDPEAVIASWCRFIGLPRDIATKGVERIALGLEQLRKRAKRLLEVDFQKLDDPQVLRAIWGFSCQSERFDEHRATSFTRLNIQQQLPWRGLQQ